MRSKARRSSIFSYGQTIDVYQIQTLRPCKYYTDFYLYVSASYIGEHIMTMDGISSFSVLHCGLNAFSVS